MRRKTKFSLVVCFTTVTVLTGCGFGNMIFPAPRPSADIGDYDDPKYINKYLDRPVASKPQSITDVRDNLFIAAGVLKSQMHWQTSATGKVQAQVGFIPYDQQVVSYRTINNDENEVFFETNTISAFVKKAEQRFINENSWLTRAGDKPTMSGAVYNADNIKAYSKKDYLANYGSFPNNLSNYVLNDYSVLDGKLVSSSDGLYTYSFTLDHSVATALYAREVSKMAGVSDYPIFSYANITITIDDNWVIHEVTSVDKYNISMMGGLNCTSTLTDSFTYSDSYINIPAKGDFSTKFGTVDGDSDEPVEKTAMDYLTEAAGPLMTATGGINGEINLSVNGKTIPAYVKLNLNDMEVSLSLADKVYIIYKNDNVFISLGDNINLLAPKDEILDVVKHYAPDFSFENISLESLLASDLMSSMMDDMVLTKEEDKVIISLNSAGMNVAMNLKLDNNGAASFDTIDVAYDKDDLKLNAAVRLFTPEHKYMSIPQDVTKITNLAKMVESIDRIDAAKSIGGVIDLSIDSMNKIAGNYIIDFSDKKNIKALANIDLTLMGEKLAFELMIVNDACYLTYSDNLKIRCTFEELTTIIKDLTAAQGLDQTQTSSLNEILDTLLSDLDKPLGIINSLFKNITSNESGFGLDLSLASFDIANNINLQYLFDEDLFKVVIEDLGSLTLTKGVALTLVPPTSTDYITASDISGLANSIIEIVNNPKFDINLQYNNSGNSLILNGKADVVNQNIYGEIAFDFASVRGTAGISYNNGEVFFTFANKVKALLTPEELIQLVDKMKAILENDFKLSLSKPSFNAPSIKEILDSVRIDENGIKASLGLDFLGIEQLKGNISLSFDTATNTLRAGSDDLALVLSHNPDLVIENNNDTAGSFTYQQIVSLIDNTLRLPSQSNNISVNVKATVDGKTVEALLSIARDGDKARITANIAGYDLVINIVGDEAYIDLSGAKISGDLQSLSLLTKTLLQNFNIEIPGLIDVLDALINEQKPDFKPLINAALSELKNIEISDLDLDTLINNISYQDDILSLNLNIQGKSLTLRIDFGLEKSQINVSYGEQQAVISFSKETTTIDPVLDPQSYLDLRAIGNLTLSTMKDLQAFFKSQDFNISIPSMTFKVDDKEINVSGSIDISIADLQAIKARGEIFVAYNGDIYTINVLLLDDVVYLDCDGVLLFKSSFAELDGLVKELMAKFGLSATSDNAATIDIKELLSKFNQIVREFAVDADSLRFNLDLSELGLDSLGYLSYQRGNGLSLVLSNLGEINISSSSAISYEVPNKNYLTAADISNYVDKIYDFATAKKYQAAISLSYPLNGEELALEGTLVVDLDKKLDLSFTGSLSTQSFFTNIAFTKYNDRYYIDLESVQLVLTQAELALLLQDLDAQFALGLNAIDLDAVFSAIATLSSGDLQTGIDQIISLLPSADTSIDVSSIDIKALLHNLVINAANIDFTYDANSISNLLGELSLNLDVSGSTAIRVDSNGIIKDLLLTSFAGEIKEPSLSGRLTYEAIDNIFDAVTNIVSGTSSTYSFNADINNNILSGDLSFKYEANSLSALLNLSYQNYSLSLTFIDEVIYLDVDEAKVKISFNEALNLVTSVLEGSGNSDKVVDHLLSVLKKEATFDPSILEGMGSSSSVVLGDIIKSFNYHLGAIDLELDVNGTAINLITTLSEASIDSVTLALVVKELPITVNLNKEQTKVIEVPTLASSYLDLNALGSISPALIESWTSKVTNGVFSIDLNGLKVRRTDLGTLLGVNLPEVLDNVSISGNIKIDISDLTNIKANLDLLLRMSDQEISLVVSYRDQAFKALIADNLGLSETVDGLNNLIEKLAARFGFAISKPDTTVDVESIVKSILSKLNSVLTAITVNDGSLVLSLSLTELGYDDSISVKVSNDYINLVSNSSGEITLAQSEAFGELPFSNSIYYLDGVELYDYIEEFDAFVDGLTYSTNFSIALAKSPIGALNIGGTATIDLNNKLDFSIFATVFNKDFHVDLTIDKIGELFYIDMGNIQFTLSIDDLVSLINRLESEFGIGVAQYDVTAIGEAIKLLTIGDYENGLPELYRLLSIEQAPALLSATTDETAVEVKDILSKLDIYSILTSIDLAKDKLKLSVDLNKFSTELGYITISLDKSNGFYFNIEGDSAISNVTILKKEGTIVAPTFSDSLGLEELNNIITKGTDVLGFLTKKQFSLTANGTIMTHGVENFSYEGSAKIDLSDMSNIKLAIDAVISGPYTGSSKTHIISLKMSDNRLYGVYNNKLKFQIGTKPMLQLVRYLVDVMGINSDIISGLLDGVTEGIEGGVFDPIVPEIKPMDIDINRFINMIEVKKDDAGQLQDLAIKIDAEQIYQNLSGFNPNKDVDGNVISTTNSILEASFNTKNDLLSTLSISNIYSQAGETFGINLAFDDIYQTSTDLGISAPGDASTYFNFDGLTDLLKQFFLTANVGSYQLTGELGIGLDFKILGVNMLGFLGTKYLPLKIWIELDENSVPTVHANISLSSNISYIGIVIFKKGNIDIYYSNGMIYIKRDSEYAVYSPSDFSNNDKIFELLCLVMKPGNIVKNEIKSSLNGGFTPCDPIIIENVLTNFQSSHSNDVYSYDFGIKGSAVMQKNLEDVTLNIQTLRAIYQGEKTVIDENGNSSVVVETLDQNYLSYLNLKTKLMGILAVDLKGTLDNIYSNQAPTSVTVPIPDKLYTGTGW